MPAWPSRRGTTLATGFSGGPNSAPGGLILWDVATRQSLAEEPIRFGPSRCRGHGVQPRRQDLAVAADVGLVLRDVAVLKPRHDDPLPVKEGLVQGVAFSPDGKTLAAGYDEGRAGVPGGVVVWDAAAHATPGEPSPIPSARGVHGLAFSPSGTLAAGYDPASDDNDEVGGVVLGRLGEIPLADLPLPRDAGGVVAAWPFSPDGKTLAAGYRFGGWGHVGARSVFGRTVDGPALVREGVVDSVAFSPDGKTLAARI